MQSLGKCGSLFVDKETTDASLTTIKPTPSVISDFLLAAQKNNNIVPENQLVLHWKPFLLIPENSKLISDLIDIAIFDKSNDGLYQAMSFGTMVSFKKFSLFCIDFYGHSQSTAINHIKQHIAYLKTQS